MSSCRRISLAVFILSLILLACGNPYRHIEIGVDEIPVYPNAQNIAREGPTADIYKAYTWHFTTTDTPDTVWQFYVDEIGRKWKLLHTADYRLTVQSCPVYYLTMTSEPVDSETYLINIRFSQEPCI